VGGGGGGGGGGGKRGWGGGICVRRVFFFFFVLCGVGGGGLWGGRYVKTVYCGIYMFNDVFLLFRALYSPPAVMTLAS